MVQTRPRMYKLEMVYRERKVRTRGNKMEERHVSQRDFCGESLVKPRVRSLSRDTVHVPRLVYRFHSARPLGSPLSRIFLLQRNTDNPCERFQTVWICSSSREVRQMENELPVRGVRPRRWGGQTMISCGVTWSTGATSSLERWSRRLVLAIRFY